MPEAPLRRPRPRRKIAASAPEPRFARIAAAIGEPTRARMLAVLLSGELVTAGEIAQAAGVTPQTASAHLALLVREQLVLAVSRDVGTFDLGLDIAAFGSRQDFGFPENVNLDAYALVNATVRFRATDSLTLQGRLENAFDEVYTFAQGYRTEGRAYTIGVRYGFE